MGRPFLFVQRAHGHHTALWSELTAPRPGELGHHLASAVHPVHYKNDLLPSNQLPTPMHRNPVLLGPGFAQQGAPRSLRLGGMKAGSAVRIAGRLAGSRELVLNSSEAGQRPVHRPAFVQPQLSSAGAGPVTLTAGHEQRGGKRPAAVGSAAQVLPGLLPLRTLVPVSDPSESRSRALTNSHCPWSGLASLGFQSPIGPYLRPCSAELCREPLRRRQIHKGELVGRRTMTTAPGPARHPHGAPVVPLCARPVWTLLAARVHGQCDRPRHLGIHQLSSNPLITLIEHLLWPRIA